MVRPSHSVRRKTKQQRIGNVIHPRVFGKSRTRSFPLSLHPPGEHCSTTTRAFVALIFRMRVVQPSSTLPRRPMTHRLLEEKCAPSFLTSSPYIRHVISYWVLSRFSHLLPQSSVIWFRKQPLGRSPSRGGTPSTQIWSVQWQGEGSSDIQR